MHSRSYLFIRTCVWYVEVLAVLVGFGLLNTLIEGI